jgi:hypothetical protein
MKAATRSIWWFGAYLAVIGLLLMIVPEATCRLIGLRSPGDTIWPRLAGALFVDVAFYCLQAARHGDRAFIRRTVATRPWTIVLLLACVATRLENPVVLVFGLVDLVASAWTFLALDLEFEHVTKGCEVRLSGNTGS